MNNSECDSYDKNDMQKKVNILFRLHETMPEKSKTVSHSEPIQILTLVLDKWSGLEGTVQNILIPLNTLSERHMKSKK